MRPLAVAILVVIAAGCDKQRSPVGPTLGGDVRVDGRVLDYANGSPIAGATVAFENRLSAPPAALRIVTAVTDALGAYTAFVPTDRYQTFVDGQFAGNLHITGSSYRGDLLARSGTCVGRYGIVTNAQTHRQISGATVSIGGSASGVVTGRDGWYRFDFGCPPNGRIGSNTTFIEVTHPSYAPGIASVGRGISGVSRVDIELQRR